MSVHSVRVDGAGTVDVTVTERGAGRPVLLLHGGAGPMSVMGFAQLLADRQGAHVFVPTHPGFSGTPRPDWLSGVPKLAQTYAQLLDALDLQDVLVVGNSIGGWVAAELTLLAPRRVSGLVLVDAGGIDVPGHPTADVFTLSFEQVLQLSWHNPAAFPKSPAPPTDAERTILAANRAALAAYGGNPPASDPTLLSRLRGITRPTLVVWGESDRIVDPGYGRAYAAAIPGARFQLVPAAGHVPQLEAPEALLGALQPFAESTATKRAGSPR
ncbi:MAG: alpha/beta hydrolase [Thermoplasmata archaeon]|nr:alpha/beta hydrolase [Thermoplasmata archaeon]